MPCGRPPEGGVFELVSGPMEARCPPWAYPPHRPADFTLMTLLCSSRQLTSATGDQCKQVWWRLGTGSRLRRGEANRPYRCPPARSDVSCALSTPFGLRCNRSSTCKQGSSSDMKHWSGGAQARNGRCLKRFSGMVQKRDRKQKWRRGAGAWPFGRSACGCTRTNPCLST